MKRTNDKLRKECQLIFKRLRSTINKKSYREKKKKLKARL